MFSCMLFASFFMCLLKNDARNKSLSSTILLQNVILNALFIGITNNRHKSLNSNKKGSKPHFVGVLSLKFGN